MASPIQHGETCFVRLDGYQHVRVPGLQTCRVSCRSGLIWITREGDLRDWVLRAGESAEFPGTQLLIGALRPSEVELTAAGLSGAKPVSAWSAFAALFARRLWNQPPGLAPLDADMSHVERGVTPGR